MTRAELIGNVASAYLRRRLFDQSGGERNKHDTSSLAREDRSHTESKTAQNRLFPSTSSGNDSMSEESEESEEGYEGTARFMLDSLTAEQMAAIARAIVQDADLANYVDIKLPADFLQGQGLPADILTEERATYYRHASCDKPALLLATTGDDEAQSLREIESISTAQFQSMSDVWVSVASMGLPLSDEHVKWWTAAINGLQTLSFISLDQFADYVLRTRLAIADEGLPLIVALGAALPALGIPKDSDYFTDLHEKHRGWRSKWQSLYSSAQKKRGCYLLKQNSTGMMLSEDELARTFEKVYTAIPDTHHATVQAFVHAPGGWNTEAANLAECEWAAIQPLFDTLKREKFNLGKATIAFYDEREAELLSNTERDYLLRLIERKTTAEPEEEDELFYSDHRHELREERKLKSHWDRFIFGKPKECHDFLAGIILCLQELFNRELPPSRQRTLLIQCEQARSKKGLRDLNTDAGLYFAQRYKGLPELFGSRVQWDVGELFRFADLVNQWKAEKQKKALNKSTARTARQLKFAVILRVEMFDGMTIPYKSQLLWWFDTDTVASQFYDDWQRLVKNPLVYCSVNRETISSKGHVQMVNLANVQTFMPAFGRQRGSFVAPYKKNAKHDIAMACKSNFKTAIKKDWIDRQVARIEEVFESFETLYMSAIRGFDTEGLAHPDIKRQLVAYKVLLRTICNHASGDRSRNMLLKPLLQIGTVTVGGGAPTAVVAPWHPFRLAAMVQKAQQVANLIKHLLTVEQVHISDMRLFFNNWLEVLEHPFYPELVLAWFDDQPELLSVTDTLADYSLHECPVATNHGHGAEDTNENPTEATNQVLDLVKRYLALHPHEKTNLSVVLYDCDSARLPQAVVDKIGALHADDDTLQCQIVLRHRDNPRLHRLYERINEADDANADTFSASEVTQDFMARLRISIMADQAPTPDPRDGCPNDIVFSQDVIARHASLEWYQEDAMPEDINKLQPANWSRRRPAAKDDMRSVVYLCCPVQSEEGWVFLMAITSFMRGEWKADGQRRFLPARQLDFQDPTTKSIFEETHNLGTWVVNYDELLDRRQLVSQGVQVIRYKQSAMHGRHLVISSNEPLGLLRSMLLSRLKDLDLGLDDDTYRTLAQRFIDDANEISGDIVLRAARRGRSASELIGVVLSQFLIRHEIGTQRLYGWFFLDDYADWFGQREQHIADILALCPEQTANGQLHLTIVITEAKYIDIAGLTPKRRESQRQLRDTMRRFDDALAGIPERFDRPLWLARLSDMLLDGVLFSSSSNINPSVWRRAIREGQCTITLRGYSHVFVSGPPDAPDCATLTRVPGLENAYQEVFNPEQTRELVLCYHYKRSPAHMRKEDIEPPSYQKRQESIEAIRDASTSSQHQDSSQHHSVPAKNRPFSSTPSTSSGTSLGNGVIKKEPQEEECQEEKVSLANLLGPIPQDTKDTDTEWLQEVESRMRRALQQFQLQSKVVGCTLTPNAALLRFAGSANLTVDHIVKRRSEFLTTHGLNIVSVQPEPGMIAVAIERPQRQVVRLERVWQGWQPECSACGNQQLLIAIREDDGQPLFLWPGPVHAPHTLIAGSTGSGKSVLMQNIILGIAATNMPTQARIILVDPKQGVDYFSFEGLPHLTYGLIDEQEQAIQHLQALVTEMDRRYGLFRKAKVKDLHHYNQKSVLPDRLPVIWLIHDEFAEWMLIDTYREAITATVKRLGIKARAAGIYLVFAAQRPDAQVLPPQLRSNLGNRLILRVDSEGTSEIALGEKGAERLLGRGHLLAKLEGSGLCYAQVPCIEPAGIEHIVERIRAVKE